MAKVNTGICVRQSMSIAAVYLAEIPPPEVCGKTASLLQLYIVTGIASGLLCAICFSQNPWSRVENTLHLSSIHGIFFQRRHAFHAVIAKMALPT